MRVPSIPADVQREAEALALPEAIVALLWQCGAMVTPHSGRNLWIHLTGTCRLLRQWGQPQAVCLAGLFHSIYGTNAFTRESFPRSQRESLRELIGEDAEVLAWTFCHVDRPRTLIAALKAGSGVSPNDGFELAARRDMPGMPPIRVDLLQFSRLVELEAANLMEQGYWDGALLELCWAVMDWPVISHAGRSALLRGYADRMRAATQPCGTTERRAVSAGTGA